MKLAGITRVRNESLIIDDTIKHFLQHCEHIFLYDDCSTDDTVQRAERAGGDRITVVRGDEWRINRVAEETRHRGMMLDMARNSGAQWVLCFDADERLDGTVVLPESGLFSGYRFRLFDGYLTEKYPVEYAAGELQYLPRMWGPEYRDILMLFRTDCATYVGLDRRVPVFTGYSTNAPVRVKHFGKCLSVEHWNETCRYYSTYFPRRYSDKWNARIGKAMHTQSDFGRELFSWDDLMANENAWVKI